MNAKVSLNMLFSVGSVGEVLSESSYSIFLRLAIDYSTN